MLGALTMVAAALPPAAAFAGKAVIDAVVARSARAAVLWILVELLLIACLAATDRAVSVSRQLLGERLAIEVNQQILEKAEAVDLPDFERPDFYDDLVRAWRDAGSRPAQVVLESFQLLQHLLTLSGYLTLLTRFSWLAALMLLVAALPAAWSEAKFAGEAFELQARRIADTRRANYYEYLVVNEDHAKETRLFELGRLFISRWRSLAERFHRENAQLLRRSAAWTGALSLVATCAFYGCYVWMAIAAVAGAFSVGDLALYVVAFRQGQQAFQAALMSGSRLHEHGLYMSQLFRFLDVDARPISAPSPSRADRASEARVRGIRFDGISFRYPGREEWALREVSFAIPVGCRLALVGGNGAGKSTVVKLLTGLYQPTAGRVLVDGLDVREWDRRELRARIAVVLQDFARYQLRVRENVALGSVEHVEDEDRTWRAVKLAGAEGVVRAQPRGLDAQLGRWFDDGVELSGGEWQQLAIARGLVREEADIIVLDEPAASLDALAEHAMLARLRELSKGRTSIVISHRLATARAADTIVVLEGGRVAESGTHEELLVARGKYAALFESQAEGYR